MNSLKDFTSAFPFKRELKSRVLLNIPVFIYFLLLIYISHSRILKITTRRIGWGLINLFAGRGEGVRDQFSVIHHWSIKKYSHDLVLPINGRAHFCITNDVCPSGVQNTVVVIPSVFVRVTSVKDDVSDLFAACEEGVFYLYELKII